jgi:hypothetical protein
MRNTAPFPAGIGFQGPTWRADRPLRLPQAVHAALRVIGDALRRRLAEFRRRRQERANYLALCELDVWTLRDLGVHPCERRSVVTDACRSVESIRSRLVQSQLELPF